MEDVPKKVISVEELKSQPYLWYKLHVLIYDLWNFQENSQAQERLDTVLDISYIGMPYFDQVEAQQLKAFIVDTMNSKTLETLIKDTLGERLERRMKKRVDSGDYRVCAAHDIALIFEKTFSIKAKYLQTNIEFLALLKGGQLEPKDIGNWKGLPNKSFQPKNKHKKR